MRDLDLIIIGDEACGTTRAYLSYLKVAGLRPKALWLTRFLPASEKVISARKFPFGVTIGNYFHRRQSSAKQVHDSKFVEVCRILQNVTPLKIDFCGEFDYGSYAKSVKQITCENYSDPFLQRLILANRDTTFLYTNGGIVPGSLLSELGVKFFHIHPGIVPYMRGSDCFLWSLLARGRAGASCFYMSAGIDEGKVISVGEFTTPDLRFVKKYFAKDSEEMIYRALSLALDPHMRAMLFVDTLLGQIDQHSMKEFPTEVQDIDAYMPYLWMHPDLRYKVIGDLIAGKNTQPGSKLEMVTL